MKLTSGRSGYFNVSVTLSLMMVDLYLDEFTKVARHALRAVLHAFIQLLGSCLGAFMIVLLIPNSLVGMEKTGVSTMNAAIDDKQSSVFFAEWIFSFLFVLVILSIRNNENRKSSLMLAFVYIVIRALGFPLCGSTFNPTRAFAHSLAGSNFHHYYIFLFGPLLGAACATAFFILIHKQDLELEKA